MLIHLLQICQWLQQKLLGMSPGFNLGLLDQKCWIFHFRSVASKGQDTFRRCANLLHFICKKSFSVHVSEIVF